MGFMCEVGVCHCLCMADLHSELETMASLQMRNNTPGRKSVPLVLLRMSAYYNTALHSWLRETHKSSL